MFLLASLAKPIVTELGCGSYRVDCTLIYLTDCLDFSQVSAEGEKCLQDFFLSDPLEKKNELKHKKGGRAKGTCVWIFGTEDLTNWLGSGRCAESRSSDILWLHGLPGMGKSTMSIYLAEELLKRFSTTSGMTLAYFLVTHIWRNTEPLRQCYEDFYSSWFNSIRSF